MTLYDNIDHGFKHEIYIIYSIKSCSEIRAVFDVFP